MNLNIKCLKKKVPSLLTVLILSLAVLGSVFFPAQSVEAAETYPLAMVYYGQHDSYTDQRIVNARPEILIDNTPAGFWHGNANSAYFQSFGIKVFSYIDASYGARPLADNYALIDGIAAEGTYGVFMDQASPSGTAYNQSIYNYAKSRGLVVMINAGMPYVDASIYSVADYVMTDEHYQGRPPTAVEAAHLSQTVVIGFGATSGQQAATWSNSAWANGFPYTWHEQIEYMSLPVWLEEYISLLTPPSGIPSDPDPDPNPDPEPSPTEANTTGRVASVPVPSGGANEYNLYLNIISSTVTGISPGQQVWIAATTNDFPNLLTVGTTISGNLDHSLGWWVLKKASTTTPEPVNQAPILAPIGNKSITVGDNLQFTITASDPDSDALSYSTSGLPTDATFDAVTQTFSWTPVSGSTYSVTFSVSDGSLSDSETITITVLPATTPSPVEGNTTGRVASVPSPSGGANEYNLYLSIISSMITGITPGQQVWLAATTTDFPNLLTVGATISGNLDHSPGWWVLKKAASTSPEPEPQEPDQIIEDIDIQQAYNLYLQEVQFIDIRTPSELIDGGSSGEAATGFIPGMINIDFEAADFQEKVDQLDKDITYVIYCRTANRTTQSKPIFEELGFKEVYNMLGGIVEWKAAGYPLDYYEPEPEPESGNTTGIVASTPSPSGGANEYNLYLEIINSTVTGISPDQQVWLAATTTDFPNLLTVGATLSGNLDHSLGWWILEKATSTSPEPEPEEPLEPVTPVAGG